MLDCFQVLDPDYSTSVTLVWMLDCFRFQIQISHFSVDVGLFSGLRSRLLNISHFSVDVGLFSGLRSRLNNICHFSVDVGLFSGLRSRLLNISHFSVDVGLFQVSDPDQSL